MPRPSLRAVVLGGTIGTALLSPRVAGVGLLLRKLPRGARRALRLGRDVLDRGPRGPPEAPSRDVADLERARPDHVLVEAAVRAELRDAARGGLPSDQGRRSTRQGGAGRVPELLVGLPGAHLP